MGTHLVFDLHRQGWVLTQELAGVVATLADLFALVGVPGARLFQDVGVDTACR